MEDCTPAFIVDQQIAAYRARDAAAFAAFYAPDAVLYDHPGVVFLSGREAIQTAYAASFTERPNVALAIETRILNGDYVIDKERLSDPTGMIETTVIYRIDGCLIGRVDFLPVVTVTP